MDSTKALNAAYVKDMDGSISLSAWELIEQMDREFMAKIHADYNSPNPALRVR